MASSRSDARHRPAARAPARSRSLALAAALAGTVAPAVGAPAVGAQAPAGTERVVHGRVLHVAGKNATPLVGTWVTLHRVGTDHAGPLDSMRTDRRGEYAFTYRTSGDTNALYFAACRYGGIAYFTAPLQRSRIEGADAQLLVYDTTSAAIPIAVKGHHIIITAPDSGRDRTVFEVFELSNDGLTTRIPAPTGGATFETLLPDAATAPAAGDGDISGDAMRFANGRMRLNAPFAPGVRQISFHYRVPASTRDIAFPASSPTTVLELLIEGTGGGAQGGGLKEVASTTVSGRPFRRFLAQDVPGSAVLRVTLDGAASGASGNLRIALVVTTLGVTLLLGLAMSFLRRGPQAVRVRARTDDPDALAREIAALDESFERISSPSADQRADHYQRRAQLKARLTAALARRDGLG